METAEPDEGHRRAVRIGSGPVASKVHRGIEIVAVGAKTHIVVGACAVVAKEMTSFALVIDNPACAVKSRFETEIVTL